MRIRRVAILIDGGFFLRRLPHIVGENYCRTEKEVARWAERLCKRHIINLVGRKGLRHCNWIDHVYRAFYYDATPFNEIAHHPIENKQIQFGKTPEAQFRLQLFQELRSKQKFALRLGHVVREDGWHLKSPDITKKLLRTQEFIRVFENAINQSKTGEAFQPLLPDEISRLEKIISSWKELQPGDVQLGLRQKGVDMRIGVDISTLTLKGQVDTIILITGDSDFVPAAKVARREGVEVILDPLGRSVKEDLNEHVDGIVSVLKSERS